MGPAAVVITGGHAQWDDRRSEAVSGGSGESGPHVMDLLFDGREFHEFRVAWVDSRQTHGTGCTLAAAVAAGLALGQELPDAVARAQRYVAGAIAHAPGIGHGRGPLDHFWGGILKQ